MACAIGRQILHPDPKTHPGFQAQCCAPAFHTVFLRARGAGISGQSHLICKTHLDDLRRRGLVTDQ